MTIDAPTFLGRLFGQESMSDRAHRPTAMEIEDLELMPSLTPDDLTRPWRERYERLAAIREEIGGQAKEHAEAEALGEILSAIQADGNLP